MLIKLFAAILVLATLQVSTLNAQTMDEKPFKECEARQREIFSTYKRSGDLQKELDEAFANLEKALNDSFSVTELIDKNNSRFRSVITIDDLKALSNYIQHANLAKKYILYSTQSNVLFPMVFVVEDLKNLCKQTSAQNLKAEDILNLQEKADKIVLTKFSDLTRDLNKLRQEEIGVIARKLQAP